MGRARRIAPRIVNTPEGPRERTRMAGDSMERDQRRVRDAFAPQAQRPRLDRDRRERVQDRAMDERREERRQRREERRQTFGDSFREQRREQRRESDRPERIFSPIRTRPRPTVDPERDTAPDRSIMPIDPRGRRDPRPKDPNASIMPVDPRGRRDPRPERPRRRDQNINKTDI
tara:strand:- start:467 stop:988 length:522 start_codon:yes stop_codon:yes gene_type:complete